MFAFFIIVFMIIAHLEDDNKEELKIKINMNKKAMIVVLQVVQGKCVEGHEALWFIIR